MPNHQFMFLCYLKVKRNQQSSGKKVKSLTHIFASSLQWKVLLLSQQEKFHVTHLFRLYFWKIHSTGSIILLVIFLSKQAWPKDLFHWSIFRIWKWNESKTYFSLTAVRKVSPLIWTRIILNITTSIKEVSWIGLCSIHFFKCSWHIFYQLAHILTRVSLVCCVFCQSTNFASLPPEPVNRTPLDPLPPQTLEIQCFTHSSPPPALHQQNHQPEPQPSSTTNLQQYFQLKFPLYLLSALVSDLGPTNY